VVSMDFRAEQKGHIWLEFKRMRLLFLTACNFF
jgi:hypothetical protein